MTKEHGAPDELHNDAEIAYETEGELSDAAALQIKLKKLKEELAKAKSERQEFLDGWQRCKADSVNLRKDAAQSAERMIARSKESFVEDLLPVLDGFDMAAGSSAWETLDTQWRSGIDQIRNQLLDVLSRNGLERFGKIGEKIDHAFHEVIEERDDLPGEAGTIARIIRHGYKMGGQVIRPAHVILKK